MKSFSAFTGCDVRIALTGRTTERKRQQILADLHDGAIDILYRNHASFRTTRLIFSLGLVVTDEQHRFGVLAVRPWPGKGRLCLIHDGYAPFPGRSPCRYIVGSRRARPSAMNLPPDERWSKPAAVGEALRRRSTYLHGPSCSSF